MSLFLSHKTRFKGSYYTKLHQPNKVIPYFTISCKKIRRPETKPVDIAVTTSLLWSPKRKYKSGLGKKEDFYPECQLQFSKGWPGLEALVERQPGGITPKNTTCAKSEISKGKTLPEGTDNWWVHCIEVFTTANWKEHKQVTS